MTVGNLVCLFLYPSVVRRSGDLISTDYWFFSVSELICILMRLWQDQFCHQFSCISKHAPLYSVSCLQCDFPSQGYKLKYKSWLYFLTKGTKLRTETLIPTYYQVVSIKFQALHLSVECQRHQDSFSSIFAFGGCGWS